MNLRDYLKSEGALSVGQLARALGMKTDAQVRQWQHAYDDRQPGAGYCMAIERATGGKVRVWDLRPDDWHRIWPMLIGTDGAPEVPAAEPNGA